jgi:dihydrofolate reductase
MKHAKENRKVIVFNLMSLDGFFEYAGHDINWHNVDASFNDFAVEQLDTAGALIFGRVTYDLMASFWPSDTAIESDPHVAERMNRIPKLVFSRTLEHVRWQNTRLLKGDPAEELNRLKQADNGELPRGDLFIFGSANLTADLLARGLVDEIRVIINPLILGKGTPMFQNVNDPIRLELTHTRAFPNGNVLLYYRVPGRNE